MKDNRELLLEIDKDLQVRRCTNNGPTKEIYYEIRLSQRCAFGLMVLGIWTLLILMVAL